MNEYDIFVVSLEKDYKRREKLGIIPDYIYAVNGQHLDIDELKKDGIININNKMTKGEIGCYLSHIHMLKKTLETNKQVLIIEDDAKIEADTFQKIKELKDNIPDFQETIENNYEDLNQECKQQKETLTTWLNSEIKNQELSKIIEQIKQLQEKTENLENVIEKSEEEIESVLIKNSDNVEEMNEKLSTIQSLYESSLNTVKSIA